MLKKKYYDGTQVQSIITEELNDGKLIMQMLKRFADAPSADVRENMRGKWVRQHATTDRGFTFNLPVCSVCSYGMVTSGWNYCPNCGADMRGENDGE